MVSTSLKNKRYYQGQFVPKNKHKYKGNISRIIYRSSLEMRLMKFLDENENILEWSSEETIIPYISPKDGRLHRYYPDFYVKRKDINDKIRCCLIEVKPKKQTLKPIILKDEKNKKKRKKLLKEAMLYQINNSKWDAAKKFCEKKDWDFIIMTEDDLKL